MADFGFLGWAIVVIGGIAILGAAIFYGMRRTSESTPTEKAVTEAATERLYKEEERKV